MTTGHGPAADAVGTDEGVRQGQFQPARRQGARKGIRSGRDGAPRAGPGSGQVAIVLGDLPGARWRWNAEADGKVRLPEIGVTVTAPSR